MTAKQITNSDKVFIQLNAYLNESLPIYDEVYLWIGAYQKTTRDNDTTFSGMNEYITLLLSKHFKNHIMSGKLLPKILIVMIDPNFETDKNTNYYMNSYLTSLERILKRSFERYTKFHQRHPASAEENSAMQYDVGVIFQTDDHGTSSINLKHVPTGMQVNIMFFPLALNTSYDIDIPEVLTVDECFTQLPSHGLSYSQKCSPISDNWVTLFKLLTNYLLRNHNLYIINTAYIYGSNNVYHEHPDDVQWGKSALNVYYDTFCELGFMMDYWTKRNLGHLVMVNCPNCINPFERLTRFDHIFIPLTDCETFKN